MQVLRTYSSVVGNRLSSTDKMCQFKPKESIKAGLWGVAGVGMGSTGPKKQSQESVDADREMEKGEEEERACAHRGEREEVQRRAELKCLGFIEKNL